MEAFIAAVVFGSIGLSIVFTALYLVVKAAVRNGIKEARRIHERELASED